MQLQIQRPLQCLFDIYNTLSKSNKRRHIEFYKEVKDEFQKQLSTEKIDIHDVADQR